MSTDVTSKNPVVKSILLGNAPPAARLAAARGLLPLRQSDLLEALIHLSSDVDPEVASAAQGTLDSQPVSELLNVAKADDASPSVLGYLASLSKAGPEIHEAVAGNNNTPDKAIALLAGMTSDAFLLEFITL